MSFYQQANTAAFNPGMHSLVSTENLGHVVRRIMYTNSGSFPAFRPMAPDLAPPNCRMLSVTNTEWERFSSAAKAAMEVENYGQAEAMWLKALAEAKRFHEGDSRLLYTFEQLGQMYSVIGHYEQAELFWTKGLDLAATTFGTYSLKVANCLEALARIHCRQQRFKDAETLLLRQVAIYEYQLGSDHRWVAVAVNNLAKLFQAQGKLQRAIYIYEKAVRNFSTSYSADQEGLASMLTNYRRLLKQVNAVDDKVKRIVGIGERTTRIKLPQNIR